MDSDTILSPGNRLFITWVNMTYQFQDRYFPFIHFWSMVCAIFSIYFYFSMVFYDCMLVEFCFCFFVFMSLCSSSSSLRPILISDWSLLNFIFIIMVPLRYVLSYYTFFIRKPFFCLSLNFLNIMLKIRLRFS